MIKLKNLLAANMRRFGTKNLSEANLQDLENTLGFDSGANRDPKTGNLMSKKINKSLEFESPNTPEHRILRILQKELDADYQSNFTIDNQTLMVTYSGRKVEIDVARFGNHEYQYIFTDGSTGKEYEVGDAVGVEGDDTDVNEILREIFSGQIR